jgi:hypothetical protein
VIPTLISQELADWIQHRGSHWTRCTREQALAYAAELDDYKRWLAQVDNGAALYGVWR